MAIGTLRNNQLLNGEGAAEAGGPQFFISSEFHSTSAGLLAALPTFETDGKTMTLAGKNDVQSLAITAATGGDYTLSFDGAETADIDYDADKDDIQDALEGLATIGAGNVVVTGSSSPFTITFQGALAATPCPLIVVDDSGLTGSGSEAAAITSTTVGELPGWRYLPRIVNKATLNFVEKIEKVMPLHLLCATEVVVVEKGIDRIDLEYEQRDVMAMKLLLDRVSSDFAYTAPGAAQVEQLDMFFGADPRVKTYHHLIALLRNHLGYSTLILFPKVAVDGGFKLEWSHGITSIPTGFYTLAHEDMDLEKSVMMIRQICAPATGA